MVTSATAYFTSKGTTMKKHMYIHYRGHQSGNYISCIVQRLFDNQTLMVYFRVMQEYVGPTIEATITEEGEHLFQRFLDSHQDFSIQYTPQVEIDDSRIHSRFYKSVNWFGLVEAIARQDTTDNHILLSNLVNNITNNPTEGSIAFDGKLKSFIRQYFYCIQNLLEDSEKDIYFYRIINIEIQCDSN